MKKRNTSASEKQTVENPIELLKEDHRNVKELFNKFENSEDDSEKEEIVQEAMQELVIHSTIEEEIFYPAAREYFGEKEEEKELMDEAKEEHHVVDLLMEELKDMSADDDGYFAKFTVLAENVKHHIKEEEEEMFPKLKGAKEEMSNIAEELAQRKEELKGQSGGEQFSAEQPTKARSEKKKASTSKRKAA
jgi:hemerythrin superfamily protein